MNCSDFANLLCEPIVHRRPPVCDAAGVNSTADHSNPQAASPFQDIVQQWLHIHSLPPYLPWPTFLHCSLASIRISHARCIHGVVGFPQPGVPAVIFDDIPSSLQWQQHQHDVQDDNLDGAHLLHCQGDWTHAQRNPDLLQQLVQQEIAHGWVKPFPGSGDAIAQPWPAGSAIGKLHIVIVATESKDPPRLVLDSTVCNANPVCKVLQKVSWPGLLPLTSIALSATKTHSAPGSTFCSILRPQEHGCLLLDVARKLYHHVVCHFGAKFSAYWWPRAGGQMLRIVHALLATYSLATYSHCAWLYVDDLLALSPGVGARKRKLTTHASKPWYSVPLP